jgi:hypothetical protein
MIMIGTMRLDDFLFMLLMMVAFLAGRASKK